MGLRCGHFQTSTASARELLGRGLLLLVCWALGRQPAEEGEHEHREVVVLPVDLTARPGEAAAHFLSEPRQPLVWGCLGERRMSESKRKIRLNEDISNFNEKLERTL